MQTVLIDPRGAEGGILAGIGRDFLFFPAVNPTKGGCTMNASIAIQVLPKVDSEDELIRIVDEVIAYIKSTGLHCHVGPFETTIEGDSYDQLMDIVKECQHVAVRAGAPKVAAYVKIVYRPEGDILTIDKKITKHQD